MFDRCHRSRAAATPVKYECDIQQVTSVLTGEKNQENMGGENWFSNPHHRYAIHQPPTPTTQMVTLLSWHTSQMPV